MSLDFPVMLMLLGSAAALQTILPPPPGGFLKVPLLAAVAFYYALDRQMRVALVAAVWAGILTDGLGGVPPGTSALVLALLTLVLAGLRHVIPESSWGTAAGVGAIGAPLLALAHLLMLHRRGYASHLDWTLLISLLLLIPAGAAATGLLWRVARSLDLWAGNVAPRKEIGRRDG